MTRKLVLLALAAIVVIALVVAFFRPSSADKLPSKDLGTLVTDARAGNVSKIEVHYYRFVVTRNEGSAYTTPRGRSGGVRKLLADNGVDPESIRLEYRVGLGARVVGAILEFLPLLLFAGLATGAAFYFARSRAS